MSLFRTLNEEELTSYRNYYRDNDLFRHWSPILCQLERECGGRDAISLWACSEQCLNRLRRVPLYRETEIDYILRELLQETDVVTAVTVMCVVLIRLINAVEKGHEDETFNNEPMCIAIMSILMNNLTYKPVFDMIAKNFFGMKIGFDGNPVVIQPSDPMNETLIMEDVAKEDKEQTSKAKYVGTDTDDIRISQDFESASSNGQNNNDCIVINAPTNCTFMMPSASPSSMHKPKTAKPKSKPVRKARSQPMTLKYFTHGNNGVLMQQRKRVHIVFRKFAEWKWIDGTTAADDFDSFFEGEPRHCNIKWTGTSTILTILLQELLNQTYIERQTACSAKSLVEQQFGKTANSDRKRLDNVNEERIMLTLFVLDINNPLPEIRGRNAIADVDIQDAALMEIYAGKLRSTKGI